MLADLTAPTTLGTILSDTIKARADTGAEVRRAFWACRLLANRLD